MAALHIGRLAQAGRVPLPPPRGRTARDSQALLKKKYVRRMPESSACHAMSLSNILACVGFLMVLYLGGSAVRVWEGHDAAVSSTLLSSTMHAWQKYVSGTSPVLYDLMYRLGYAKKMNSTSQVQRYADLLNEFPQRTVGPSVLDFGCGAGYLLEFALANQVEFGSYHGVDVAQSAIDLARQHFSHIHWASFESVDIRGYSVMQRYDVIVCSEVLGYLTSAESKAVVETLRTLVNPRGTIIITQSVDIAVPLHAFLRTAGPVTRIETPSHSWDMVVLV